jgi:hypothetical protein
MPQQPGLFDGDITTPHRRSTLKAVGAVVAVALVPLALVVGHLPERAASTTVQPAASTPGQPLGSIAIKTGATSTISLFTPTGTTPVAVETLSGDKTCGVVLGSTRLLNLRGSLGGAFDEGLASYATGSIGVKEKKSGTSCAQVNAPTNETLELKLGAATAGAFNAPALMSAAYLDLELKQSAQILATASRGGVDVGRFELRSGTSSLPITPVVPDTAVAKCSNGADSGPDSGVGDNCRWAVSAGDDISFDTLTLKAVQGAFSLEGGGDGLVTTKAVPLVGPAPAFPASNSSIIEVVDGYEGVLGCGDSTPLEPQAGDAPGVIVHRLNNVGGADCVQVPYFLGNGAQFAQFLKPLDTQTGAQFVWEVTWRLPYTATTSVLPQLTLDYETGSSVRVDLGWCPDATTLPVTAPWSGGYNDAQLAATNPVLIPDQDDFAGKQFACVISREAEAVDGGAAGTADDYVQARDFVYVLGDATMRR